MRKKRIGVIVFCLLVILVIVLVLNFIIGRSIKVEDKDAPVIVLKDSKLEVKVNEKINLLDNVSVSDNSGESVDIKVEGDYDLSKAGSYTLYYVASDSSSNTSREEFTLVVKEEEKKDTSDNKSNTSSGDKTFTTSKGFSGDTKNGITYIDGYLVVNKTYSLPSSYGPGLDSGVKNAAEKMFAAAKLDGFDMRIQSGFRSYDTQKRLYNNYVSSYGKEAADTFSARPGYSEHQSGLAFDVCQDGYGCINSSFDNTPPAKWLASNAYKYGFILRYPKGKENETGYMYESWHFRYVGEELASKLYNDGDWITLEDYFGITSEYSN